MARRRSYWDEGRVDEAIKLFEALRSGHEDDIAEVAKELTSVDFRSGRLSFESFVLDQIAADENLRKRQTSGARSGKPRGRGRQRQANSGAEAPAASGEASE